jgi:hypothetical protein
VDISLTPEQLVGLLAEPDRLAVIAALVLGATTPEEVAAATGLDGRVTSAALSRLRRAGLVTGSDITLAVRTDAFKEAAKAAAPDDAAVDHGTGDPRTEAVLRAFVRDGRITQMPVAASKRLLLLEHVATTFEPGVRYPEAEVNAMLRAWYDDYAALRRYLVDEGLLSRQAGEYWRTGGPVDV